MKHLSARHVPRLAFLLLVTATPAFGQMHERMADRLAITEVVARYSYTLDFPDANAYAALYTKDGVWELFGRDATKPLVRLESREQIRNWAEERNKRLEGIKTGHHQSGLLFLELTENTARTRNMLLLTYQADDENTPTVKSSGTYEDTWRKTPDGWRFAHRVVRLDGPLPKRPKSVK